MSSKGHGSSRAQVQEISVVVHRERKKRVSIMQLPDAQVLDKTSQVTLSRQNNLKEYKSVYNIDAMPTEGAGSEFGREAKEEARRRKYGFIRKNYNPDAQPWQMTIGPEKSGKKYKGTRNGGLLENASYFIFTRRPDGMFEATPVEEWHNFKPVAKYKNLNDEEAEELFAKRDKTLNMFNIMVRKRINKDGGEAEEKDEDDKEGVKKQLKSKGLMLTEMEDWADLSDEDGRAAGDGDSDSSLSSKKKKGKGKGKAKKRKDKDTDDEAVEDSDDGDMEAKQVDYMSDTSDSDSDNELRQDKTKYEQKGVEDEDGLRDIVVESDEEKDNPEDEKKEDRKGGDDKSSSSSDSESDDPDREDNDFTKAFLMTGSKKERGKSPVPPRSTTPNEDKKRKLTSSPGGGSSPLAKKVKQEPGTNTNSMKTNNSIPTLQTEGRPSTPSSSAASASRDGLTEETVRRYLMRKPLSSKDLFKLFKSKKLGMTNEQIAIKIAEILKRIKTVQQKINGVAHFSIPVDK